MLWMTRERMCERSLGVGVGLGVGLGVGEGAPPLVTAVYWIVSVVGLSMSWSCRVAVGRR